MIKEIDSMDPEDIIKYWFSIEKSTDELEKLSINLVASESHESPNVRKARQYRHRFGFYPIYKERINRKLAIKLAKKLFNCKYVEIRPISCSISLLSVYYALSEPGDTILVLPEQCGGHKSHQEYGMSGCRGLKTEIIPFDSNEMNIDINGLRNKCEEVKPKLIVVGGSVILFPLPLAEIREIADDIGSSILYDGAHVSGLIAGKSWQQPLEEGADILIMSNYKTLSGPSGGMIFTNDEEISKKINSVCNGILSNVGYPRIAALAVAMAEFLKFGREYTSMIVKNAKTLANALDDAGLTVLGKNRGFTESHQVLLDVSNLGLPGVGGDFAFRKLREAHIQTNPRLLPYDKISMHDDPSGIRIGTTWLTRHGMKEKEMLEVAGFMKRVLIDKEEPSIVASDVSDFRDSYKELVYCFSEL